MRTWLGLDSPTKYGIWNTNCESRGRGSQISINSSVAVTHLRVVQSEARFWAVAVLARLAMAVSVSACVCFVSVSVWTLSHTHGIVDKRVDGAAWQTSILELVQHILIFHQETVFLRIQPRTFCDAFGSYIVDFVLTKVTIWCIRAGASSFAFTVATVFVVRLHDREVILFRELRRWASVRGSSKSGIWTVQIR